MIKFNYNEPEFKVIVSASQDVITTSLEHASDQWDTNRISGGTLGTDILFNP